MSAEAWLDFTDEQKLEITKAWAELIKDVHECKNLETAANQAGQKVLGKDAHIYSIRDWAKKDKAIAKVYDDARAARAEGYVALAHQAAESIEDFWDCPVLDAQCNIRLLKRERQYIVNKVKMQVEHWRYMASTLSPETYGDYCHELKQIDKRIKEIETRVSELHK